MSQTLTMTTSPLEAERKKKALVYTLAIMGAFFGLAVLVSWKLPELPEHFNAADLIEINLGNDLEGYGKEQPLIKGEKAPGTAIPEPPRSSAPAVTKAEEVKTDDEPDKEAAPVPKVVKSVVKVSNPQPVVVAPPKPQVPKYAGYQGTTNGKGNGANEDNGYRYQGNNPNGKGDAGSPNGKPDSYGNSPGGKVGGGPRVTSGDRKIIRYYSFTADLEKAIIYAVIKVSPDGKGTFAGFAKNSTSRSSAYASAIAERLPSIQFDKADHESSVTVQFNFTVN